MNFLKIFQILTIVTVVSCDADYCDKSLCGTLKHIACDNSNDFSATCPSDAKILELSEADINAILNEHNKLRNKIASGQESGFSPARKMTTMIWNDELAKLAELNAKSCKFEHDKCRNTEKFKYAGQNIALSMTTGDFEPLNELIKGSIDDWYSEVKDAKQSDVDKYESSSRVIGHFTQIVNDLSNEVGCAAIQFTDGKLKTSIFVCDYARTNILHHKIYTSGIAASGCSSINNQYGALCSTDEITDANLL